MGAAIPTEERDHLSGATITELSKRQTDVEAHQLPKLPRGVVPKGWDGWGRPWALIDCPADKVPQVASNSGCERVTVAVLVVFPPEPFNFPNATSLDYAMRYRSMESKKGTLTLEEDGQWKDPAGTYKKLKLPTYQHSVLFQELLHSHRWTAFQDGRWGNRPNPPIPEGDVRPSGGATIEQSGLGVGIELPPTKTPGSPVIPRNASPATSHSLQTIVLSSDQEEAAEEEMELTVPASPPKTAAPRQVPSHALVAEIITNMVMQIRRTGASTSTVSSTQQDSQASGSSARDPLSTWIPRVSVAESNPPRASSSNHSRSSHRDRTRSHRQPVFPADETTIRWTAPGAQPRWKAEEPESLADLETSVCQVGGGAADVATGGLIQFMERIRTHVRYNALTSASRFGPPGPVQHLMGQVQSVWDCASVRQNRIDALIQEKEPARGQCDQMATAQTNAQREIRQLRASNDQLQKDNSKLRQELLVARATPRPSQPPSVSSGSSTHSGLTDQEQIKQLRADNNWIRGEREALRKDNEKLKAANTEWRAEACREKLRNDITIDRLWERLEEAEDKLKQFQEQPSSHLPSHQEMGGGGIDPTCLPLRDEHLSPPRLRNHRDVLLCHPLLVNLPIWELLAPHRYLN